MFEEMNEKANRIKEPEDNESILEELKKELQIDKILKNYDKLKQNFEIAAKQIQIIKKSLDEYTSQDRQFGFNYYVFKN